MTNFLEIVGILFDFLTNFHPPRKNSVSWRKFSKLFLFNVSIVLVSSHDKQKPFNELISTRNLNSRALPAWFTSVRDKIIRREHQTFISSRSDSYRFACLFSSRGKETTTTFRVLISSNNFKWSGRVVNNWGSPSCLQPLQRDSSSVEYMNYKCRPHSSKGNRGCIK